MLNCAGLQLFLASFCLVLTAWISIFDSLFERQKPFANVIRAVGRESVYALVSPIVTQSGNE
jgi:hypothetical protein